MGRRTWMHFVFPFRLSHRLLVAFDLSVRYILVGLSFLGRRHESLQIVHRLVEEKVHAAVPMGPSPRGFEGKPTRQPPLFYWVLSVSFVQFGNTRWWKIGFQAQILRCERKALKVIKSSHGNQPLWYQRKVLSNSTAILKHYEQVPRDLHNV